MDNPILYKSGNVIQRREVEYMMKEACMTFSLSSPITLLDIGCGPGDTLNDIIIPKVPRYKSVVGIDKSKAMLQQAQKSYGSDKIRFVEANIESEDALDKIGAKFSHITSSFCLNWVQNHIVAFRNIMNLLLPGGEALIMFAAKSCVFDVFEKLSTHPRWRDFVSDWRNYVSIYHNSHEPKQALAANIEKSDVKNCRLSLSLTERTDDDVPSREFLAAFLEPLNPFLKRIPASEREEHMQDCVNKFIELYPPRKEGMVATFVYQRMLVHLKKE